MCHQIRSQDILYEGVELNKGARSKKNIKYGTETFPKKNDPKQSTETKQIKFSLKYPCIMRCTQCANLKKKIFGVFSFYVLTFFFLV